MKFIIDIPEKDVQGCYCCPLNYDCISCSAPDGPDYADICEYLGNSDITTRPEGCPLVPLRANDERMDKPYPETVGELLAECEAIEGRYDLFTLGMKNDEPFARDWPDGTDYLAGEFQYGVGMVPVQWVTHVLCERTKEDAK